MLAGPEPATVAAYRVGPKSHRRRRRPPHWPEVAPPCCVVTTDLKMYGRVLRTIDRACARARCTAAPPHACRTHRRSRHPTHHRICTPSRACRSASVASPTARTPPPSCFSLPATMRRDFPHMPSAPAARAPVVIVPFSTRAGKP